MFLRIGQAAQRLGVSPDTVRRWIDMGRLEAVFLPGSGERRVSDTAVEAMRRTMHNPPEPEPQGAGASGKEAADGNAR